MFPHLCVTLHFCSILLLLSRRVAFLFWTDSIWSKKATKKEDIVKEYIQKKRVYSQKKLQAGSSKPLPSTAYDYD